MGLIDIGEIVEGEGYSHFDAAKTKGGAVRVGKVLFEEGARVPPDGYTAHEENEYVCILKGTIAFGTEEGSYSLKAGDFHHMPKGVRHWCQNVDKGKGELLYVMVD